MTTLYIIGNGFDLWHGLPTSYSHFYTFAKNTLDELESYFCINLIEKCPWCDFENSLGTFDWKLFYETHDNTDVMADNFRPSEAYGLEDDLTEQADNLVRTVVDRFREWINGVDISMASKKMRVDTKIRYLTFNYTSTLQDTYEINEDNILHIHGNADRFDDLVFGHGETIKEKPELDENGDSNRTMFSDAEGAAKYPFYALRKPVDEVISKKREYFESLNNVTEIVVIGHSLNEIDLPYFREIAKNASDCNWTVCCYTPKDKTTHVQQLLKCGIRNRNIQTCTYEDLPACR